MNESISTLKIQHQCRNLRNRRTKLTADPVLDQLPYVYISASCHCFVVASYFPGACFKMSHAFGLSRDIGRLAVSPH